MPHDNVKRRLARLADMAGARHPSLIILTDARDDAVDDLVRDVLTAHPHIDTLFVLPVKDDMRLSDPERAQLAQSHYFIRR